MSFYDWQIDIFKSIIKQAESPILYNTEEPLRITHNIYYEFDLKEGEYEIIEAFAQAFSNSLPNEPAAYNQLPIAIMTFYLSSLIACDPVCRSGFYHHYDGYVPHFLQFLLDHIRIGSLGGNHYNSAIFIDWEKGKDVVESLGGALTLFDVEYLKRPESFGLYEILAWFGLLNDFYKNGNTDYFQFVKLNKVPLVADSPVYLCELSVFDGRIYWKYDSHFAALSETEKPELLLLAQCLNAKSIKADLEKINYKDGSYDSASCENDDTVLYRRLIRYLMNDLTG